MTRGLTPVPEAETVAWITQVDEFATWARVPARSAKWFYRLADLLRRLWQQNRDQKAVIEGMQETVRLAKKQLRQENLKI